jgi:hypothetical protein
MTVRRLQKNYQVTYQVADGTLADNQLKIDNAFDILFDSMINNQIDNNRQERVYCNHGISNKKRGCEIL